MASAWFAANSLPADEVPAWKRNGVRCGEGSTMCLLSRWKNFPSCLMVRMRLGSIYSSFSLFSMIASSAQLPSQSLASRQSSHITHTRMWGETHLYRTLRYSSACAYLSSCSIGLSSPIALNAAFFQLVTIFHPNRPSVR